MFTNFDVQLDYFEIKLDQEFLYVVKRFFTEIQDELFLLTGAHKNENQLKRLYNFDRLARMLHQLEHQAKNESGHSSLNETNQMIYMKNINMQPF